MSIELRIELDALPVGGKKQVQNGDAKVLFVRDQDGVRAFQATCPHYGAPLEKGEICGSTLYCPWHKAAFDLGDGGLREPPALKSLDRYRVRIEGGQAIATLEAPKTAPVPRDGEKRVLVVGSGAAAVAAITTLRREGFAGSITMIGREEYAPYDRTKLSKTFLAKATPAAAMLIEEDFDAANDVEHIVGEVSRIVPRERQVTLTDGRCFGADAILIATGSRAVMPAMEGATLEGVYSLRSLEDAEAISRAAGHAKTAVIIGGGFIALEAAAFLIKRGLDVSVLAPEALPLADRFGEAVAQGLKAFHQGNGVRFVTGKADHLRGDDQVRAVVIADGTALPADLVLIGTGAAPEVPAIEGVTAREDGGIAVDGSLAVAPAVFVAGDIAAYPGRDGQPIRIEHWRLAQQHGIHAAHAILGRAAPFDRAPFFWSNQGDKRLDYAGHAPQWDRIVMRGDPAALDFIAYYVKDDHAVAACSIGRNAALTAFLDQLDREQAPLARDL